MFNKTSLRVAVTAAAFLATVLGNSLHSVQASRAAYVKDFYANCHNFSVDVSVTGAVNDGQGLDNFRYEISDGAGHILYTENATRTVGSQSESLVYNVVYQNNAVPTQNPITLKIVDTDPSGKLLGLMRQAYYDASCLKISGQGGFAGIFAPPESFKVVSTADTQFYDQPGGAPSTLSTKANQWWVGVYRTADNQWVGIYVNGNELRWLPASAVSRQYALLPIRPTQIERTSGIPDGISMTPGAPSLLRSAPSLTAPVVTHVDTDQLLKVTGRNSTSEWVRVEYQGQSLWVYYALTCLMNGDMQSLPIVAA